MAKRLYVGNLSWNTTEDGLREAFSKFGTVSETKVISDKFSGRSKGFGFVEFEDDGEAEAAIAGMNDADLDGRTIKVNEARPQEPRSDERR